MAKYTKYYNLTKPEGNDNITPTIFADNFEKIDQALALKAGTGDLGEYATTEALRATNENVSTNADNIAALAETIGYLDETLNLIVGEDLEEE